MRKKEDLSRQEIEQVWEQIENKHLEIKKENPGKSVKKGLRIPKKKEEGHRDFDITIGESTG